MKFVKLKHTLFVVAALLFGLLTACSSTTATDPAENYKGQSAEEIFQRGEAELRDKNYSEAIKRFEALDAQYPYGRDSEVAQLHIIYAYYMTGDYASTEAAADRYIHSYPVSPHVDYAYYLRGLADFNQNLGVLERIFSVDLAQRDTTQIKKAYDDFALLVRDHPHSEYAPAAYQYMIYLRNILANHELQVSEYYFGREAYVAAANRANLVVRHYQGAPAVPKALVIMARSYRALHLTQNENETMRVLNYNYPNSSYVQEAMKG